MVLLAIFGFLVYSNLFPKSPPTTTKFSDRGLDIKVSDGRPYKKDRLIFGEAKDKALQPYGKYWRLGANAATEITFSENVTFAGKPINAGTYRMYAIPGETSFQGSLNSQTGVFFGVREPDYTKDVLKVDVLVTIASDETEQFTINFAADSAGVNMNFVWDKFIIRVPITQ